MSVQGLALHIGLNLVDPGHYGGWDGALAACEFDARDMRDIAQAQRFQSTTLLTAAATVAAVTAGISQAARELKRGDIFLLTYSGHGGQVPDRNGDERDPGRQDETWVLWDRQFVDDELWMLWKKFRAGVRILVLSDSCHSGTVTRVAPRPDQGRKPSRVRLLPPQHAAKVYRAHAEEYDAIQRAVQASEVATVSASVLLISGCQDNQLSSDGDRNGLFTGILRKVWKKGAYKGGYRAFRDEIARKMPAEQTPNYLVVGRANASFEGQKPFCIT